MDWATPLYSRGRVNRAGKALINDSSSQEEREETLSVIGNWRSAHGYPLQILKMVLLNRAVKVDEKAFVAQRLKRITSIAAKLRDNAQMDLTQMQDIGGCRAVMRSVPNVYKLASIYKRKRKFKNPQHLPQLFEEYDYIKNPKIDGYRSLHLVYKYRSRHVKRGCYRDLRIEIQLRSQLQHAWATAVETVSTFMGQKLRSSSGDKNWRRFFALMGSALAIREGQPIVPETPTDKSAIVAELRTMWQQLSVEIVLLDWSHLVERLSKTKNADMFLLVLNEAEKTIYITGFTKNQQSEANDEYLKKEKESEAHPEIQVVLVSVDDVKNLRRAYPNYFLDTRTFLRAAKEAIA